MNDDKKKLDRPAKEGDDIEIRRLSAAAGMGVAGAALGGIVGLIIGAAIGAVAGHIFIEDKDGNE